MRFCGKNRSSRTICEILSSIAKIVEMRESGGGIKRQSKSGHKLIKERRQITHLHKQEITGADEMRVDGTRHDLSATEEKKLYL
jgi:hypothetical protein